MNGADNYANLTEEQKTFYKRFWSTRKYYSDPPQIFQNDNFKELQEVTERLVTKHVFFFRFHLSSKLGPERSARQIHGYHGA